MVKMSDKIWYELPEVVAKGSSTNYTTKVSISVDGLPSGVHNVTLSVHDSGENSNSDLVWVIVQPPSTTSKTYTTTPNESTTSTKIPIKSTTNPTITMLIIVLSSLVAFLVVVIVYLFRKGC